MNSEPNLDIVLRNLKNGDEATFKFVFDTYYRRLVSFAESFLIERGECEDMVQALFLHIWENSASLNIDHSLQAYLFRSLKNRCLNKLKELQIREKHELLYVEALATQLSEGNDLAPELLADLKNALSQLPSGIRQIIELRYFQEKKVKELSSILGISENTIKTQLLRGKAKLRTALDK